MLGSVRHRPSPLAFPNSFGRGILRSSQARSSPKFGAGGGWWVSDATHFGPFCVLRPPRRVDPPAMCGKNVACPGALFLLSLSPGMPHKEGCTGYFRAKATDREVIETPWTTKTDESEQGPNGSP